MPTAPLYWHHWTRIWPSLHRCSSTASISNWFAVGCQYEVRQQTTRMRTHTPAMSNPQGDTSSHHPHHPIARSPAKSLKLQQASQRTCGRGGHGGVATRINCIFPLKVFFTVPVPEGASNNSCAFTFAPRCHPAPMSSLYWKSTLFTTFKCFGLVKAQMEQNADEEPRTCMCETKTKAQLTTYTYAELFRRRQPRRAGLCMGVSCAKGSQIVTI